MKMNPGAPCFNEIPRMNLESFWLIHRRASPTKPKYMIKFINLVVYDGPMMGNL